MLLSIVVASVLSQRPTPEAAALEKLSAAAERLAAAAERMSPPPPEAVEAAPPKEDIWNGSAGAGLTWISGNVNSIAFVANAQATRKSARTILTLKGFGGYGEALDPAAAVKQVLLFNAGLAGQFDLRFTKYVSAFLGAGLDTDHVKSVELRGYADLGVGVLWLDKKEGEPGKEYQKVFLKSDLSLRVQPETRYQYYPVRLNVDDTLLVGPRLAGAFRYALTRSTTFQEDLELIPNVLGESRLMLNSTTKIAVAIAGSFALTGGLAVKFDSNPSPGLQNTDTVLNLGVETTF